MAMGVIDGIIIGPPTHTRMGGTWGDIQRSVYQSCYRKDGQLKRWAQKPCTTDKPCKFCREKGSQESG